MAEQRLTDEPIRVLLVDDNPEDIAIVRRLLAQYRKANFQVLAAYSTDHCLERLQGEGADLLVLDYSMPGEDGVSFLRRLSLTRDHPPVVVLTGRGDERVAVEAIRSGAVDYFPKDAITPTTLGGALQNAFEQFRQQEECSRFDEEIMVALAAAAEGRDPMTAGHLHRLSRYALLLGRELGLGDDQLQVLRCGALLHDIGKLAMDPVTLTKSGPLTEEELEELRQHPVVGERICSCLWIGRQVSPIIRHHHERWDGSGYVDGLAGTEIPLLARIVSVVDAFDAMSSNRPYRTPLPQTEVVRRLREGAGHDWDPTITETLIELVGREGLGQEARRERNAA